MNWNELKLKLNDPDYVRSMVDPEKILAAYKKVRLEREYKANPIELQRCYMDMYPIWKLVNGKWEENTDLYREILKKEIKEQGFKP